MNAAAAWSLGQFRKAAPAGRKFCKVCQSATLSIHNEHSRCHRCRAEGRTLITACEVCGVPIVQSCGRRTCGAACRQVRHNRRRRKSAPA